MKNTKKKHIVKIPRNVTALYCEKKKIITILGPVAQKSLKLKVKITLLRNKRVIKVSSIPFSEVSNNQKKNMLAIQGTTVSLIKQLISETFYISFRKLKLVGVGYRSIDANDSKESILSLKLGYSHLVHFRISKEPKISSLKRIRLFVYGSCYTDVAQIASMIRSYKKPEPYKGKGILYETEKIKLKEGKKI